MARTEYSDGVSAGAGIAIAGAWLASAGLSIIIMLIMFVWSKAPEGTSTSGDAIFWIILLIAAPMIAAYSVTRLILNRD